MGYELVSGFTIENRYFSCIFTINNRICGNEIRHYVFVREWGMLQIHLSSYSPLACAYRFWGMPHSQTHQQIAIQPAWTYTLVNPKWLAAKSRLSVGIWCTNGAFCVANLDLPDTSVPFSLWLWIPRQLETGKRGMFWLMVSKVLFFDNSTRRTIDYSRIWPQSKYS